MASTVLTFLLFTSLAALSAEWTPSIEVGILPNGTVFVTVRPVFPGAHSHKLCIGYSTVCFGHVQQEGPAKQDSIRFKVTDLSPNHSYYIYVRPFNRDNQPLDDFIMRSEPLLIPPGVTPTSATPTSPPPADDPDKHSGATVALQILGSLVALLLVAGILLFILWHRGYWRKISLLRCCGHQSIMCGQPLKVMQLFVSENPEFNNFVSAHWDFLKQWMQLESLNCNLARDHKDPDAWMKSMIATHHVLIYLSPTLGHHLEDGEEAEHTHLSLCLKAVQHLHQNSRRRKFSCGGASAMFVVSGCFPTDAEHEATLPRKLGFPCHRVTERDPRGSLVLETPRNLVRELCGCAGVHWYPHNFADWPGTAQAELLLKQAVRLTNSHLPADGDTISNGSLANSHYYQPLRVNLALHDKQLEPDTVFEDRVHFHTCREGGPSAQYPHRTDSGFSSATTDPRDRNSDRSSDGNSPDGCYPELPGTEEEPSERDTLIRHMAAAYPSDQTLHFVEPEDFTSEIGSQSNIVEKLRCLNERTDQHWKHEVA